MGRLTKPGLTARDRSLLYTHEDSVERDQNLEHARLQSGIVLDAGAIEVRRCLLERAHIKDVRGSRWQHSTLATVDAANALLEGSSWLNTLVDESRFTGARLNDGYLKGVTFADCTMRLMQMQNGKCQALRFERCDLRGAYFNHTSMPGVVLEACDLRGADFSGADIKGADLRRSQIEDIRIAPDQLRGVIVSSDQAIYLARLIGLDVRE